MQEERWQKLEVWKEGDRLAFEVYQVTKIFPKEEVYGLTSQLRRAALSVPTNIVEGYSRKGDKTLAHFVNISLASLAEVKYLLHFSNRLGNLSDKEYFPLKEECGLLGKRLWRFYEKIRGRS